ncbi:MAG: hypothetical protein AMXMBFR64_08380 [Myxococcales bacterium]
MLAAMKTALLVLLLATPALADPPDTATLIRGLASCESLETCEAARALIALGPGVWPGLSAALDAPDELTRFWALGVLSEVPVDAARERVAGLLGDPKVRVRAAAAFALGAAGSREATPALLKALSDVDLNVRFAAVVALGRVRDPASVEPLVAALRDKDDEVRGYAAEALGSVGDRRATGPLVERVEQDLNVPVRVRAATALGELADPSCVDGLLRAAASEKEPPVLGAIAYALGRVGDPKAGDALRRLEGHEHEDVRVYARDALDRLRKK